MTDVPNFSKRQVPRMIRIVTAIFTLALVICALIVVRPFSDRPVLLSESVEPAPLPQVTRAVAPEVPLPEVNSTAAVLAAVVAAAAPDAVAEPASSPDLPTAIATDESSMQEMTSGVLAGLGIASVAPQDSALRDQTALALTGIRLATGQDPGNVTPQNALQTLVVEALRSGQSDDYIDTLVNEAARAGAVSIPQVLVTADGRVDTHVLLASIVTQAGIAAGEPAPLAPAVAGGEGVEVRVVQRVEETAQYRFYTVSPGDSLGAIAVKFYGSVEYFPAIFDANRAILSSPDMVRPGQRLVIPDL